MTPRYITAEQIRQALTPAQAVRALEDRLRQDPPDADRPSRTFIKTHSGELLVMPDESAASAGLKLLSIARGNPSRGLPAIQGVYLLMDSETLTPKALLDAAELTCIRTSAISLLAISHLNPPENPSVSVIGSGPQAAAHVRAAQILRPRSTSLVSRNPQSATSLIAAAKDDGIDISMTTLDSLVNADVIICCTTSRDPILHRADVKPDSIVVAIGSHEPTARELGSDLLEAFVAVETRDNARREAGDIILAEKELSHPVISADLAELVKGDVSPTTGVRVFKSVGDAWQDLTTAEAVLRAFG
jgi:ornithine cyclodeaminase